MENAVRICFTEGPIVIVHNAPATEIRRSYPLWNDIIASEFFPPNASEGVIMFLLLKNPSRTAARCDLSKRN
jgi:hypothetical protein